MAAAALMAGGAGLSAYAQISAADAKADAARRDARDKGMQAVEVAAAGKRENMLLQQRGMETESAQAAGYAQNGFDVQGAPLMALESTANKVTNESIALKRNYDFRISELERGAQNDNILAGETQQAGYIGAFGSILGGAGRAAASNNGDFSSDKNDGTTVSIGGP